MSSNVSVGDKAVVLDDVTESDVEAFSELSGDSNPLHLNEEYAKHTMFGRRIAHGMLASGFISAALAELPGCVIYLSQDLEFHNPVDIGSEIVAEAEVAEDLGDNQYRVRTIVTTDGDETAIDGEAIVMITDP